MRCLLVMLALAQFFLPAARAETISNSQAVRDAASHYLADAVISAYPGTRPKVDIGAIDSRLDLSGCEAPTFFLATGSRLWGSGSLGVQCSGPAKSSLYLTYRIRLKGPALLARRPLPSAYSPLAQDLITGEVEYSADPGHYPLDPGKLHGARLTMPLAKNAPLTVDILRARTLIQAGQRVRIIADGPGFQVTQEGIAQQQAGAGDLLRLKLSSGRYIQGTVQNDGTVYIKP